MRLNFFTLFLGYCLSVNCQDSSFVKFLFLNNSLKEYSAEKHHSKQIQSITDSTIKKHAIELNKITRGTISYLEVLKDTLIKASQSKNTDENNSYLKDTEISSTLFVGENPNGTTLGKAFESVLDKYIAYVNQLYHKIQHASDSLHFESLTKDGNEEIFFRNDPKMNSKPFWN